MGGSGPLNGPIWVVVKKKKVIRFCRHTIDIDYEQSFFNDSCCPNFSFKNVLHTSISHWGF